MYEESVAPAMHIQTQQNGFHGLPNLRVGGDANNGQQSKSYGEDETSQSSGGLRFRYTSLFRAIHCADETIAAARQRFDEARVFRRVAQRFANLVGGGIQDFRILSMALMTSSMSAYTSSGRLLA